MEIVWRRIFPIFSKLTPRQFVLKLVKFSILRLLSAFSILFVFSWTMWTIICSMLWIEIVRYRKLLALGYYSACLQLWSSQTTFRSPALINFTVLEHTITKLVRHDERTNATNLYSYAVPMMQWSKSTQISSNVDNSM